LKRLFPLFAIFIWLSLAPAANADFYTIGGTGGGGGGGVSSITGDTVLFSNSASTGAVTLTQATASGNSWFGVVGSTAIPIFNTTPLPIAMGGTGAATVSANTVFANDLTSTSAPGFISSANLFSTLSTNAILIGNTTTGLAKSGTGIIEVDSGANGNWGDFNAGFLNLKSLANPAVSSVTPVGTGGGATWSYIVGAVLADTTTVTSGSISVSTTTGNSTLSGSNYNRITWGSVTGASYYNIYRVASGGSPSSTGLIGQVASFNTSFNDTGQTGTGTYPNFNFTSGMTVNNIWSAGVTPSSTNYALEAAPGGVALNTVTGGTLYFAFNGSASYAMTSSTLVPQTNNAATLGGASNLWSNIYGTFITATHQIAGGAAPSVAAGTGAGTSPTISIAGHDTDFAVTLTTGTLPAGTNATIFTATFGTAYGSAPYVYVTPANANAATLMTAVLAPYATSTTTTMALNSGTTAITAATQYIWNVHCGQ
jgi:hypothetical protein